MARTKKQLPIPGTEKETIKEVDSAAEAYVEARDERIRLTDKEVDAKDALVTVMKKHKLDVYRDENAVPPLIVTLIPGEDKVKVSRAKDEEDEEGESDE
jgi:hypothetical protein